MSGAHRGPVRPSPTRLTSWLLTAGAAGGAWAEAVAEGLCSAGVPVATAYPTGRHVLDVCLEDNRYDVAVECQVHPEGADRHIERHLALRRAGWTLLEAYRSRWGERPAELTLELLRRLEAAGR